MKKIIMLVAALLVIASGIMAVGAYEGHLVDVKAHVENAIGVSTYEKDLGVVFPEDDVETQIQIGLSNSFREQQDYSTVKYELWWEPKPIEGNAIDPDDDGYFEPISPFILVTIDGNTPGTIAAERVTAVQAKWDGKAGTIEAIGTGELSQFGDQCDYIHFSFDVPNFDWSYNKYTDPKTPENLVLENEDYILVDETFCGFTAPVPHADLGNNLKIQVVGYSLDKP